MSSYCKDPFANGKDSHKRHLSYIFSGTLITAFFVSLTMAVLSKMPWNYFIDEFMAIAILIGSLVTGTAFSDAWKARKEGNQDVPK